MNSVRPFTDRIWMQTALFIAALIPVTLLAFYFEQRTFNGINLWIKPLKFQTSSVVHLLTLFLVVMLLTEDARRKMTLLILIWLSSVATVFEIWIITLRASQATASHYNFSTPSDIFIYSMMGVGAVSMLLPAIYLGVVFLRNKSAIRGGVGLRLGIGSGFFLGSVLTLLFASYLSASGSHWTSGQSTDAGGLPLFGWSQTGGDLRPAHFFALHMLQVVPIAGMIGDKYFKADSSKATWLVWIALIVMGGMSIFTFLQALDARAFIS